MLYALNFSCPFPFPIHPTYPIKTPSIDLSLSERKDSDDVLDSRENERDEGQEQQAEPINTLETSPIFPETLKEYYLSCLYTLVGVGINFLYFGNDAYSLPI